jgi:hypothetical protein
MTTREDTMTRTTTANLSDLSDEDLALRRDALALDVRHDHELRGELDEAAVEFDRRSREADHDFAAERERERRDREAAAALADAERKKAARRLLKLCRDRIANAGRIDAALSALVEALGAETTFRAESQNAAVVLGLPAYGLDLRLIMTGVVAVAISDAGLDGSRPLSAEHWRRPLAELLGEALGGTTNQTAPAAATKEG